MVTTDITHIILMVVSVAGTAFISTLMGYAGLVILLGSRCGGLGGGGEVTSYPAVSVLIAARGEAKVIPYTLEKLLKLRYPRDKLEVVVAVEEGDDETLSACKSFTPHVKVVKVRSPGGKPSALNQSLPTLTGELILLLDADSVVDEDSLLEMVKVINEPKVLAVTGVPYPLNISDGILPQFFAFECELWRKLTLAKDKLGLFVQAPGFFSLIKRRYVEVLGGWDEGSLAEDNDLAVRLYSIGGRIRLVNARVGVEAPAKLMAFIKQRIRWYRGTLEVLIKRFKDILKLDLRKGLDLVLSFSSPAGTAAFLVVIIANLALGGVFHIITLLLLLSQIASTLTTVPHFPPRMKLKLATLIVPYVILNSVISLIAIATMVLGIRVRWWKTEKLGTYVGHLRI